MKKIISLSMFFLINLLILIQGPFAFQLDKKMNELIKKLTLKPEDFPPPENAIEMKLMFSFPSEELVDKEIYLSGPKKIAQDSVGNIYVTDLRRHEILKFDSSGQFIRKFGQMGQGPGDFNQPFNIIIKNEFIIVQESRNRRYQFFGLEGKYIKSFHVFKFYQSPVINNIGLIFGAPMLNKTRNPNGMLIEVLSPKGELLYSFGEPLRFEYDYGLLNRVNLALNKKGELFVAFKYFPIVRKYNLKGELLGEYKIYNDILKKKEKLNLDMVSYRSRGAVPYDKVLSDIFITQDELYLFYNRPRLEIFVIDKYGKIKVTYYWKSKEKIIASDLLVQNNGSQKRFYLLSEHDALIYAFGQKYKIKEESITQIP